MFPVNTNLADRLLRESWDHYKRTRQIYAETGYDKEYPLNFFWGADNMRQLTDIINRPVSALDKIALIHQTFMFSINTDDVLTQNRIADWYTDYLHTSGMSLDDFDISIQESPFSNPDNSFFRNGRLLSPDFLRTVLLCLEIKKHIKPNTDRTRVLELGAGYGGLARTFRLFFPNVSYVITDIPETLFFSSLFLRLNFPNARVCFVIDEADIAGPLNEYDFIFIPTKFAEVLRGETFELFCNTASLGEMKNSVIRYWMDFVQNKINLRYFFGLNRFLNTIDPERHEWRLDENVCSVSFDERWRILEWQLEPPLTRCPYLETVVTRNLEVIAERIPESAVNPDYNLFLSTQIASSVSAEDWYIHADKDNTMYLRDNILGHDLTRKGTLFKLWESIRLYPRAENVVIMLKYLDMLRKDKPFEEMFYYEKLLAELGSASTGDSSGSLLPFTREQRRKDWDLPYEPNPIQVCTHNGFNIVRFKRVFYALAQDLGAIDLVIVDPKTLLQHQESGRCVIGNNPEDLKDLINKTGYLASPNLVEEGYMGFNIVRYRHSYYALAQALGPVDLTIIEEQQLEKYHDRSLCFTGNSHDEVKRLVTARIAN
jgi:putative sugar O-methyltransferase